MYRNEYEANVGGFTCRPRIVAVQVSKSKRKRARRRRSLLAFILSIVGITA